MPPRCTTGTGLFLPFLYPTLFRQTTTRLSRVGITTIHSPSSSTPISDDLSESTAPSGSSSELPHSRLNPAPDDYAISSFADKAKITIHAGGGGHGCISFLREAFLDNGPANGGDGGHGGNVYIQAVHGETSLHKLARSRNIRAARGKMGQGSSRGGQRGEDYVILVPVGTVIREVSRIDPVIEENIAFRAAREKEREFEREFQRKFRDAKLAAEAKGEAEGEEPDMSAMELERPDNPNLDKFILYPGISTSERRNLTLPRLPRRERLYHQPPGPIHLDLSIPTPRPILLAAGGVGGLGNPHFVALERPRPLFATRGEKAVTMQLELELKLLADVGFVGLPNAGKSTLLRALTNSRARVGNWAFTTLQPNIGTVVLDNYKGRRIYTPPKPQPKPAHAVINDARFGNVVINQPGQIGVGPPPRTRFTVADIPGLIEGAHLDKGLGMEFLKHVERAGVLAFVVDLAKADAVTALKALWKEVGMYARMREEESREREAGDRIDWQGDAGISRPQNNYFGGGGGQLMMADFPDLPDLNEGGLHIAAKPWFVIATKGDLPNTQDNYQRLKEYLDAVTDGREEHPSGVEDAWTADCAAIPVSAINGHGIDRIVTWTVGLLDE